MLETSVPLRMRAAREEYLSALGAGSNEDAAVFRQRAQSILRKAMREIQREVDAQYDWSLLRLPETEVSDA
jgi:hypothetical protein